MLHSYISRLTLPCIWQFRHKQLRSTCCMMDRIQEATWIRVSDFSEFLPSTEALRLHWYRCVWIANMWSHAHSSDINFLPLQNYGWISNGDFVWECNHNIEEVKRRIQYLTTGCGCKNGCRTRQCRCNAKHQKGGPGMYLYVCVLQPQLRLFTA